MKKALAFILVVLSVFSIMSCTVIAVGVEPRWNNTNSATVSLVIDENGEATVSLVCVGKSGITTKITGETKLERKWGLFWLDVDEWTDVSNSTNLAVTHIVQLSKKATYRAKTEYTVSGSGGANDTFTCECDYTYD